MSKHPTPALLSSPSLSLTPRLRPSSSLTLRGRARSKRHPTPWPGWLVKTAKASKKKGEGSGKGQGKGRKGVKRDMILFMPPIMYHEQGLQCPDAICRALGLVFDDELAVADHLVLCHLTELHGASSRLYDLDDLSFSSLDEIEEKLQLNLPERPTVHTFAGWMMPAKKREKKKK